MSEPSSPCPPGPQLVAFHRGELPPIAVDRVGAHLEVCARCEEVLQGLDAREDSVAGVLRRAGATAAKTIGGSEPDPPAIPAGHGDSPGIGATVAGRYRLIELLGEGGMGTVYMAQQLEPVRRLVAIKLIRAGMDSRQFLVRFEAERQALAMMDHPGIARVLDAGDTERGRPFFAMELVKGVPITRYCDDHRLTPRQRLELFVEVCRAVQHAHQKGVIHRDLKPSNILVARYDGRPVPKVIEFGVAKAAGPTLTEKTLVTGFGAVVGTPEYMAPEQAELDQLDVDTRCDVYSLGVLLYELLTGDTPLMRRRLARAAVLEVLRLIREEDPPRPSTRLSSTEGLPAIAANRGLEPSRLARLIRGELDWIVMKALEKDRARRYETADALGRDIERYLADEPVEAARPSAGYRLRKFARKHRGPVRFAAATTVMLVAASAVSLRQASLARTAERAALVAADATKKALERAVREQARAQEELATRESVQAFFMKTIFAAGRPEGMEGGLGREVTLRKAIDAAVPEIAEAFKDRPLIEAAVRNELGATYHALGEPRLAVEQYERTLRLRTEALGPGDPDTLRTDIGLAAAYQEAGRAREAVELYETTLRALRAALGPDAPETQRCMNGLAVIYANNDRVEEALGMHRELLALRRARLGPDHPDTLTSMNSLGVAYLRDGQNDRGRELLEQTLDLRRSRLGQEHPDTLASLHNLALATRLTGHLEQAVGLFEQVVDLYRAKFGPDHPATLRSVRNLAESYAQVGRLDAAVRTLREAVPRYQAKLGLDHAVTLSAMNDLAIRLGQTDRLEESIRLFDEVLGRKRAAFGPDHPETLTTRLQRAEIELANGRAADAIPTFAEVLAIKRAKQGPADPDTLQTASTLAGAYQHDGRLPDAVRLMEEVLRTARSALGPDHRRTLHAMGVLGTYYGLQGRFDESIPLLEEADRIKQKRLGPDDHDSIGSRYDLGVGYARAGRLDLARPVLRDYVARQRRRFAAGDYRLAIVLVEVGGALLEHADADADAEPCLREALAIFEKSRPDDWMTDRARIRLGGALLVRRQYADAEPLLKAGYQGMRQRMARVPRADRAELPRAADWLVQLYDATGRPDEAARWRAERSKSP